MNVIFLKSHTFLAREIPRALKRLEGVRTVVAEVPKTPPSPTAGRIIEQLSPHLPALVVSVNDAGYDLEGRLSRLLLRKGCRIANWYTDDPFYEHVFAGRRFPDPGGRIDFASEATFVPRLRARGYRAHFLPLAVDPGVFNDGGTVALERDVAFVGNSSLAFMDSLVTDEARAGLEACAELLHEARQRYEADPRTDLTAWLESRREEWEKRAAVAPERFLFIATWMIGYLYRRDLVTAVARRYGARFTCFGDGYWGRFIDEAQVSPDALYYENLCRYYRSTRVNLNINRIQIRTSFTNRIFDCKACSAFLLTERRELNSRFFRTRDPGRELVEYSSTEECLDLIEFYLTHEQERTRIARNGRDTVLRNHTYDIRMRSLIDTCRREWKV